MVSKNEKSFMEKRSEIRHKIVDSIYDRIPADVVEHLGKANKELIFAIEGVFDGFVKRIDDRIARVKKRASGSGKTGGGSGADDNDGDGE